MEILRKMLGWLKGEEGQGAIEYILVIVLVVLVIVLAVQQAGIEDAVNNAANKIALWIENVPTP